MSDIIIKKQSTIKTIFKCSDKNGVSIELSRYTAATTDLNNEQRLMYMQKEGFILPNGEGLTLTEITQCIRESLLNLLEEKGIDNGKVNVNQYALTSD